VKFSTNQQNIISKKIERFSLLREKIFQSPIFPFVNSKLRKSFQVHLADAGMHMGLNVHPLPL
jgi:hypothetical protein